MLCVFHVCVCVRVVCLFGRLCVSVDACSVRSCVLTALERSQCSIGARSGEYSDRAGVRKGPVDCLGLNIYHPK